MHNKIYFFRRKVCIKQGCDTHATPPSGARNYRPEEPMRNQARVQRRPRWPPEGCMVPPGAFVPQENYASLLTMSRDTGAPPVLASLICARTAAVEPFGGARGRHLSYHRTVGGVQEVTVRPLNRHRNSATPGPCPKVSRCCGLRCDRRRRRCCRRRCCRRRHHHRRRLRRGGAAG